MIRLKLTMGSTHQQWGLVVEVIREKEATDPSFVSLGEGSFLRKLTTISTKNGILVAQLGGGTFSSC